MDFFIRPKLTWHVFTWGYICTYFYFYCGTYTIFQYNKTYLKFIYTLPNVKGSKVFCVNQQKNKIKCCIVDINKLRQILSIMRIKHYF